MDEFDLRIIEMLKLNARQSLVTIGKEVGLSAPAIGKRVKQLEEDGVIEGYDLRLNQRKMGIDIKAYITLKLISYKTFAKQKEKVASFSEVQTCHRVTGDDCMILLAYFKDNAHLIEFLERLSDYGDTRTSIILEV